MEETVKIRSMDFGIAVRSEEGLERIATACEEGFAKLISEALTKAGVEAIHYKLKVEF